MGVGWYEARNERGRGGVRGRGWQRKRLVKANLEQLVLALTTLGLQRITKGKSMS